MKKSLIALAVLSATSAAAFAQSNVTIYGIVDVGYMNRGGSNGGHDDPQPRHGDEALA